MRSTALLVLAVAVAGCAAEPPLSLGITAEEHQVYFPITAAAPHALGAASPNGQPISCEGCHGGTDSFRIALCISCHQLDAVPLVAVHSGVAGFEAVDASCLSCHPTGDRGSAAGVENHSDLWFPIDPEDSHGGPAYLARVEAGESSCTACHASVEDRSIPLCAGCHAADTIPLATAHLGVIRTFVNDSVKCKACHADTPISAQVRPVSRHDEIFPVNHHAAKCTDCHRSNRAEPQEWAIEFRIAACTACHIAACTPQNPGACN